MKRVTIKEVATKAGVSASTASRALGNYGYVNTNTKEIVTRVAKELGYQPDMLAKSFKSTRTKNIGVIISDITNTFFTKVLRGIDDIAEPNGYNVILCNTDENPEKEREYIQLLYRKKTAGLIICDSGRNEKNLRRLISEGFPVVLLDRKKRRVQTTQVVVDNEGGAYAVVTHLIKVGHSRIGMIKGLDGISPNEERFQGYRRALIANNIPFRDELVKSGEFCLEKTMEVTRELLTMSDRPTALFVANGVMTMGALLAIKETNLRIPNDIAIVGFDDPEWAILLDPPLTTVDQPAYTMGAIACQSLLRKIKRQEKSVYEAIVLQPTLKIRGSCGSCFKSSIQNNQTIISSKCSEQVMTESKIFLRKLK